MFLILLLVASVLLIVVSTSRYRFHPFLALLFVAVLFGLFSGMPLTSIATNSGAYIRDLYPDVDVPEHARRLQAISQGIVITTDGAGPVYVVDRNGSTFKVRPPKVKPVDATGAGDAFRAGLLAGLLRNQPLSRSVCWGVAAGALKVGRIGAATDPASLEEVVALAETLLPEY